MVHHWARERSNLLHREGGELPNGNEGTFITETEEREVIPVRTRVHDVWNVVQYAETRVLLACTFARGHDLH